MWGPGWWISNTWFRLEPRSLAVAVGLAKTERGQVHQWTWCHICTCLLRYGLLVLMLPLLTTSKISQCFEVAVLSLVVCSCPSASPRQCAQQQICVATAWHHRRLVLSSLLRLLAFIRLLHLLHPFPKLQVKNPQVLKPKPLVTPLNPA